MYLNLLILDSYSVMSSSPSMRLVAPPASHPPIAVRPSPSVRPVSVSSTMPTVRVISAAGLGPAAAARATALPAVSMPTAPTLKRKREEDDDYDLTGWWWWWWWFSTGVPLVWFTVFVVICPCSGWVRGKTGRELPLSFFITRFCSLHSHASTVRAMTYEFGFVLLY